MKQHVKMFTTFQGKCHYNLML